MSKPFLKSKINWAAIVLCLIALQTAIANLDLSKMTTQNWITFCLGVLIIVFRTYFTNTTATAPPTEDNAGSGV